MIRNLELAVEPAEAGLRLDRFVTRRLPGAARARVTSALARGDILRNGARALKGERVKPGDRIAVGCLYEQGDVRVEPNAGVPLAVVYEDADVLVVDKPPGIPVHPLKPWETQTLANGLVARYPETAQVGDQPLFPAFIHRVDTDTSGLLAAARNAGAYAALRRSLRLREFTKVYLALVRGRVPGAGVLEDELAHDRRRPGRMVALRGNGARAERPMKAVTRYAIRRAWPDFTLLEVQIVTGVTHQIRCQLAAAGHPVAGDTLYTPASLRDAPGPPRQFLHAARLEFPHPATGARAAFRSALPDDLRAFLRLIVSGQLRGGL